MGIEDLNSRFETLCNEQESLYKPEFEHVFKALSEIDGSLTKNYLCTTDKANIETALNNSGFGNDEAFAKAFYRYNEIFVEGKQLQQEYMMHQDNPVWADVAKRQVVLKQMAASDEWLFIPISIFASPQLHEPINKKMADDARKGKGLFANVTDIPKEDEAFDELLMIDAFNMKGCLLPYSEELKQHKVIGSRDDDAFLSTTLRNAIFKVLNLEVTFAKENTQFPSKVENHIADALKLLDDVPIYGLFIQILILQGFVNVLENMPINDGDEGFDVLQQLANWLSEQLGKKEVNLCMMQFFDDDRQRLKPFTDYLYQTTIGEVIQQWIRKEYYPTSDDAKALHEQQPESNKDKTWVCDLPSELDTDRARKCFAKAIEAKYIEVTDSGLKWKFGGNRGKVRLGYFIQKVFCPNNTENIPETAINKLFGVNRIGSAIGQILYAKKVQKWKNEIDKLFEE